MTEINVKTTVITNFHGFFPSHETDHNLTDMSKIVGACSYDVQHANGYTETLETGLRPGENFGWSIKVIQAAQAWRNSGGFIPEWVPPASE
ncbi:hypothetical protein HCG46_03320 [Labrenzia sp. PO1]|jgi:hypothetical protein|nr:MULTISPECIES: hypothetical protein [unclassified Labrenzia]MBO9459835.1 hypothetical protein [Labrenzia sp. R5_0]NKI57272.1 hypothetical protein [Labrenzia sp. PO1]